MHSPLTLPEVLPWYLCTCIHYFITLGTHRVTLSGQGRRYPWYPWTLGTYLYSYLLGCQVPRPMYTHTHPPSSVVQLGLSALCTPNERHLVHLSIVQFYSLFTSFQVSLHHLHSRKTCDGFESALPAFTRSFIHSFILISPTHSLSSSFFVFIRLVHRFIVHWVSFSSSPFHSTSCISFTTSVQLNDL